jgi:hypothetical protein
MNSDEMGYLFVGCMVFLPADASMIRDDGEKKQKALSSVSIWGGNVAEW